MYLITYEHDNRVLTISCDEASLHKTLRALITTDCLICEIVKIKD